MTKLYVASTLTTPQTYTEYLKGVPISSVTINGGNSLVNLNLVTLDGAITSVTEKEAEQLKENKLFQLHTRNGFVKFTKNDDAAKATSDLESRDEASPLTQTDVDTIQGKARTGVDVDFKEPATTQRKGRSK